MRRILLCLSIFTLFISACGGGESPGNMGTATVTSEVTIPGAQSATATVDGPALDTVRLVNLIVSNNDVQGYISDLPEGTGYSVVVRVYDDTDLLICLGSQDNIEVIGGQVTQLGLTLQCDANGIEVPEGDIDIGDGVGFNNLPELILVRGDDHPIIPAGAQLIFYAAAEDIDAGDELIVNLMVEGNNGSLSPLQLSGGPGEPLGEFITYTAPNFGGVFTITATVDDGNGGIDEASFDVTVIGVNIDSFLVNGATAISVTEGDSVTFTYIASDATECRIQRRMPTPITTIADYGTIDPNGDSVAHTTGIANEPPSGAEAQSYRLRCQNIMGVGVTSDVTVDVSPIDPPVVGISANPTSVPLNGATGLTYTVSGAGDIICDINAVSVPNTGGTISSDTIGVIAADPTTFTLTCTASFGGNPRGSSQAAVDVGLLSVALNSFSAADADESVGDGGTLTLAAANETVTLTWDATNADAGTLIPCTVSRDDGGASVPAAEDDSIMISDIATGPVVLTLNCDGFNGPATASVTVDVGAVGGSVTFLTPSAGPAMASPEIYAGDFNNDGNSDVGGGSGTATPTPRSNVLVNLGGGSGSLAAGLSTISPTGISTGATSSSVADFDEDGNLDIVTVEPQISSCFTCIPTNLVEIYYGDGTGGFPVIDTERDTIVPLGRTKIVRAADIDQDGHVDLVIGDALSPNIHVTYGDGMGGFSGHMRITGLGSAADVADIEIADFVGADGLPDAVISISLNAGGNATALLVNSGGTLQLAAPGSFFRLPGRLASCDLDGDGNEDLVSNLASPSNTFAFMISDGAGGYAGAIQYGSTQLGTVFDVDCQDLNNDGFPDVVAAGLLGLEVFLNDGAGTLGADAFVPTTIGASSDVVIADLNGDSKPDVVTNSPPQVFLQQ